MLSRFLIPIASEAPVVCIIVGATELHFINCSYNFCLIFIFLGSCILSGFFERTVREAGRGKEEEENRKMITKETRKTTVWNRWPDQV